MTDPLFRPTRRIVFHGLGAVGVAVALAGCGGGGESGSDAPAAKTGDTLVATADVPVGGGIVLTDQKIVVTQPTQGDFKAFTAVCTHEGNLVSEVSDGTITCTVHGSTYSAETGENEGGPAPSPLSKVEVKVEGDNVVAA